MPEKSGPVGDRRWPRDAGPDPEIMRALAALDTTDLADAMLGANVLDAGIRPLFPHLPRVAGPAVTVTVPAGSQEARKAAMAMIRPGDVLVVDARGISAFAVLGGRLAETIRRQGAAAVVIDGCVRDAAEIEATGLPVYCRGLTVASSPKTGPGDVNVPVAVGGVVVSAGDVVVCDGNGVVVVPKDAARDVLDAARPA